MATQRVYPFPDEAQKYLRERYGIEPYSKRHLKRRIGLGLYPAPIYLSPTRPVNTQQQLDDFAAAVIPPVQDIKRMNSTSERDAS